MAWYVCKHTKIQMLGEVLFTFSSSRQLTCHDTLCEQSQGQACFWTLSLSGLVAGKETTWGDQTQKPKHVRDESQLLLRVIDRKRSIHMFKKKNWQPLGASSLLKPSKPEDRQTFRCSGWECYQRRRSRHHGFPSADGTVPAFCRCLCLLSAKQTQV